LVNKTGTLTTGKRKLAFIKVAANSRLRNQDSVLALAAGVAIEDSDDLAMAILDRARRRKIEPVEVKDVMSIAGLGRAGRLEGSRVVLGGPDQLVAHNTRIEVVDLVRADQANTEGQTVLYLLIDGDLCGYIGFADQVRKDVKFFVHLLQYRRKRVVVYSGDAHETTKFVANQLDCDGFYGEVLPHEYDNLIDKLSSDGSVILESNDLSATALQVERAVRDRRLQWATILISLVTPGIGLVVGAVKLAGDVRPSILLPAVDAAFGLVFAIALVIISRRVWLRVPKTISEATLDDDDADD
jgi:cation transport ATPase